MGRLRQGGHLPTSAEAAANVTTTDDFQEQLKKIADEEVDPRELQREHQRQLEEEQEKARPMMENLEVRVRKSFSGNFGRFIGSSDAVDGQTVGQACAEASPKARQVMNVCIYTH